VRELRLMGRVVDAHKLETSAIIALEQKNSRRLSLVPR